MSVPALRPRLTEPVKASLATLDAFGRALPVDLNGRHLAILAMLVTRPDPPRLHEVAQGLGVARSIVTRAVDCFEKHGFAERLGEPDDKRQVRIRITPEGRRFVDRMLTILAA
ncbi:MAG: MarR family transcriptional regulator [Alphaproteobacteria bacterium]|nr:MarR family transcriptional regulator [Alphaproteobacteria bacterium]